MKGRALVLGGGGITGVAWEIGLLHGLAEQGLDLTGADLVLGSSAGSVVGAGLTTGQPLAAAYQAQLAPPEDAAPASMTVSAIARMVWATWTSADPKRARARIGRMALAAKTEPEAARRRVMAERLGVQAWPERLLRVTAIDAATGEFMVFDATSGVDLLDAVGASCAVPGVWPPVTIGGRRFIDGGIRSPANADLAAGYGQVVIVAPIGKGMSAASGVRRQAARLTSAGASVVVVEPDAAARKVIGRDVLDPARRAPAARAGFAQAAASAAQIAAVWQTPEPEPAPGAPPASA